MWEKRKIRKVILGIAMVAVILVSVFAALAPTGMGTSISATGGNLGIDDTPSKELSFGGAVNPEGVLSTPFDWKNWFAVYAGEWEDTIHRMQPDGIAYRDYTGVAHTGSTGHVAWALYQAHMMDKDDAPITSGGLSYADFKYDNAGRDMSIGNLVWTFNNNGGPGEPQYGCVDVAFITPDVENYFIHYEEYGKTFFSDIIIPLPIDVTTDHQFEVWDTQNTDDPQANMVMTCVIRVDTSGVLTCLNVDGSSAYCGRTTAPGVTVDNSVTDIVKKVYLYPDISTPESRAVKVTIGRSDIPLFYLGDSGVSRIPCTVTDLIDQDVGICDGRKPIESCWEGESLIGTFTAEAGFKGWKDLSLWDDAYFGGADVDLTADPKTVDIRLYGTGDFVTFSAEPFPAEFAHDVNGVSPVKVPHMLDWEYSGGIFDLRRGAASEETAAAMFQIWINHEGEIAGPDYTAFESDKPYPLENYPEYRGYLIVNQTQRAIKFVFTEYPGGGFYQSFIDWG